MSRKYKFLNSSGLYFISFAVVYWIDVFVRNEYKQVLLDSWQFCMQNKGLEIGAWCIMPSHIHMIIRSEKEKPEDVVKDMKRFTSRELRRAIQEHPQESRREWMLWMMQRAGMKNSHNTDWQFWQDSNKPIELFSNHVTQQKLDYIHNNPVEAGFVDRPEAYLYSTARDYAGEKGLLDGLLMIG